MPLLRIQIMGWMLCCLFIGPYVMAQTPTQTATVTLDEIALDAAKIETPALLLPFAVSRVDLTSQQGLQQQRSLQEYLGIVPGLFALNANNYAQDLRVSIRGFGARAAFGIRGIKIIVDGIPETTPDGQGQVDNLPLGLLQTMEVLRGPSASLYGNASGGVLYFTTLDSLSGKSVSLRSTVGAFGTQIHQATAGVSNDKTSALFYLNRTASNGFRKFSSVSQNVFNVKLKHQLTSQSTLQGQLNLTLSPRAEDAGGLTLSETAQQWDQARSRNVDFDTYEKVNQLKVGLAWDQRWGNQWKWNTYGFFSTRDFYGKLPFEAGGIVDLFRTYSGLGSRLQYKEKKGSVEHQWQMGVEAAFQSDNRKRFQNLQGTQGTQDFSQTEYFNALGLYVVDALQWDKVLLRSSLRLDRQVLGADTVAEAQNYLVLNPSVGLSYGLTAQQRLFANFSTSFETPALSELSANPTGGEGFNLDLAPSKALNYELGWKTLWPSGRVEATFFYIKSSNEITPYELAAFPGRSFYRNSGATQRWGMELFGEFRWNSWQLSASMTQAQYEFMDTPNMENPLAGKTLPGLPGSLAFIQLQFQPAPDWTLQFTTEHVGRFYANDSNAVAVAAYQQGRLQTEKQFDFSWGALSWTAGIENLWNTRYFDNIRLNAFGGRFYEPAPRRNAYFGLTLDF